MPNGSRNALNGPAAPRSPQRTRSAWDLSSLGFTGPGHCRAVGKPLFAEIEPERNPRKIDHVWLMLDVGTVRPLKVAINTLSIRNRDAGFDSRLRVGLIRERYEELPLVGVYPHGGLDYADFEATHNLYYEHYDRFAMESLLIEKIGAAILIEVWGELYSRNTVGIHQVHCRKASCAVSEDLTGNDGALKFYFAKDNQCEMLLLKFCGQ